MFYCCGITEKGIMPHNEDAMLIGKNVTDSGAFDQMLDTPFIVAVSDGVSGELSGELASRMCLELLRDIKLNKKTRLKDKLLEIHHKLVDYSTENPDMHNMQATLCGIAVDETGGILSFNVGDSRLYRVRQGRITQLSRDQSLVQLLFEEGAITTQQRRTHVHRNIIFPAFGNVNTVPKIDIVSVEGGMEHGDVLLLCTDGISDYLSTLDIEEIMELPKPLPKRLEMLRDEALARGGKDNITAIGIVKC